MADPDPALILDPDTALILDPDPALILDPDHSIQNYIDPDPQDWQIKKVAGTVLAGYTKTIIDIIIWSITKYKYIYMILNI